MTPLPSPRLLGLQAVFRFATIGRGDATLDGALYDALREQFPMQIVRRSAANDTVSPNPHIVVGGPTVQMSVGMIQADVAMQFDKADPARLIALVGPVLHAALNGLIAGGIEPANLGVVTTIQTSTLELPDFSARDHILTHHLHIDTDTSHVTDVQARFNVGVADTFYVGLQISPYETRQVFRPLQPGVPLLVGGWEGEATDSGIQLLVDVNTFLEARRVGTPPTITEGRVTEMLKLSQTVVDDLAQTFISAARLPIDALEGALNE
jgi:hypothetical protein